MVEWTPAALAAAHAASPLGGRSTRAFGVRSHVLMNPGSPIELVLLAVFVGVGSYFGVQQLGGLSGAALGEWPEPLCGSRLDYFCEQEP